ncbi:MAG: CcmD family protein [Bdellovibrionales bacterium]|nr:CcmD family protein [Bdellovibrionales bacterium]
MEQTPDTFSALFAAYSVIWVLITLYVYSLGRRLSRLENKTDSHSEN